MAYPALLAFCSLALLRAPLPHNKTYSKSELDMAAVVGIVAGDRVIVAGVDRLYRRRRSKADDRKQEVNSVF